MVFMVDYIKIFTYDEPSMHQWNKAYLIMVDDFFEVFLDFFCEYFSINVHGSATFFVGHYLSNYHSLWPFIVKLSPLILKDISDQLRWFDITYCLCFQCV
ncbi:hypothetical protein STEG23_035051 [Scotinomys teguina]